MSQTKFPYSLLLGHSFTPTECAHLQEVELKVEQNYVCQW